ncbi:hypothetical protein MBLNU457_5291t1 [Dothideomycetes sp. NU457]
MPSLLDLPPELRLMIYDHMIDDRGGDDPERTRSLFREREQWSTYYRKGNDSGYKYVSYVKSGLNNLVHVRPPSSQRSLWARCESPRPWSCCVVFENTELAIICATCQFLGREAMPILQKHARITITGPYLLDGMSNWHIHTVDHNSLTVDRDRSCVSSDSVFANTISMAVFKMPTELRFDLYDLLNRDSNAYYAFHVHPDVYGFQYHRGSSNDSLFCQECSPETGGYVGCCRPEILFKFPLHAVAATCKSFYAELSHRFGSTLVIDFRCNLAHGRTVSAVMRYFVARFSLGCRARVSTVQFKYLCNDAQVDFKSINLLARKIKSALPNVTEFTLTLSYDHVFPNPYLAGRALDRVYDQQNLQLWVHCRETLAFFIVELGPRWSFTVGFDKKRNLCLRATRGELIEVGRRVIHADIDGWTSKPWIKRRVKNLDTEVRFFLDWERGLTKRVLKETREMRKMMAGM